MIDAESYKQGILASIEECEAELDYIDIQWEDNELLRNVAKDSVLNCIDLLNDLIAMIKK